MDSGLEATVSAVADLGPRLTVSLKYAEDCLGQDGVAAHRVQQDGGAGLRGEAGGELHQHQAGQEHHAEQLPADLQAMELAAETESSNTPPEWTSWVM